MLLRIVGKTFIGIGVFILLFLLYQLWGTSVVTDQYQDDLSNKIETDWAAETDGSDPPAPELGDAIGIIRINKIDVDWVIVEGVGVDDLKKGPGHYPGTKFPGEDGNFVVSGHRATYGAPFARMDEVAVGDIIEVEDRAGFYLYEVTETKIVLPTDLSVIVPKDEAVITITTCHPQYSVARRLIVTGNLIDSRERRAAA